MPLSDISTTEVIEKMYKVFDDLNFTECNGCFKCCYLPWMLKEERDILAKNIGATKNLRKIESTDFILGFDSCVYKCEDKKRCNIYKHRPLDCRSFPLDLIEEDGEYYWCIFKSCPKYQSLQKKLTPIISKIEPLITEKIFRQYEKQIKLTKDIFPPYKLKQYVKIRKFKANFSHAQTKKVYMGQSKIAGTGVFAKEDIKKGKIVFIMKGKLIVMNEKNKNDVLSTLNIMGIDKNVWIDPVEPYLCINHSCDPNTSVKGKVTFVALKNIKKNDELTFDYSINEETQWQMKCNCGSKNCRKIIKNVKYLPKEIFDKYQPIFPTYFKKVYLKHNADLKNKK